MKYILFGLGLGLSLGLIYGLLTSPTILIAVVILVAFITGGLVTLAPVLLTLRFVFNQRPGNVTTHLHPPQRPLLGGWSGSSAPPWENEFPVIEAPALLPEDEVVA